MLKYISLELNKQQRAELVKIRDTHAKAYMRERAAALLLIADGQRPYLVAQNGLYKCRKPDTIYSWIRRFKAEGVKGLVNKPGRGRKPAFFP